MEEPNGILFERFFEGRVRSRGVASMKFEHGESFNLIEDRMSSKEGRKGALKKRQGL